MKITTFNGQNIGLNGPFPCDMLDYQRVCDILQTCNHRYFGVWCVYIYISLLSHFPNAAPVTVIFEFHLTALLLHIPQATATIRGPRSQVAILGQTQLMSWEIWGKTWENPRFLDGKPIVFCGKQPENMGKPGVCFLGIKNSGCLLICHHVG